MTSIESLRNAGWVEIAPGVMVKEKSRKILPPSDTADVVTELGPTTACADQPGRANGSNKERAAAVQYDNQTDNQIPHAEPQRDQAPALGAAIQGEKVGVPSIALRFTGYRVRCLDPDNFAGSIKDLLDGLRHSGIILGDEPWRIMLQTEQVRVRHRRDEKTVVEVILP